MTSHLRASIIILIRIKNELMNAQIGIDYIKRQKLVAYDCGGNLEDIHKIDTVLYALLHFSFIRYVAFLDEYNKFFTSTDTTEKNVVNTIKTKCKKYITAVKDVFGEIKTARNHVLAHGYRKGNIAMANDEINKLFNQLVRFDDLKPFKTLSESAIEVVKVIEEEFGEINEDDISLQEKIKGDSDMETKD